MQIYVDPTCIRFETDFRLGRNVVGCAGFRREKRKGESVSIEMTVFPGLLRSGPLSVRIFTCFVGVSAGRNRTNRIERHHFRSRIFGVWQIVRVPTGSSAPRDGDGGIARSDIAGNASFDAHYFFFLVSSIFFCF